MSPFQYYYNVDDASQWYDLQYSDAVKKQIELCNGVISELSQEHFLKRDAERMNRILRRISILEDFLKIK